MQLGEEKIAKKEKHARENEIFVERRKNNCRGKEKKIEEERRGEIDAQWREKGLERECEKKR